MPKFQQNSAATARVDRAATSHMESRCTLEIALAVDLEHAPSSAPTLMPVPHPVNRRIRLLDQRLPPARRFMDAWAMRSRSTITRRRCKAGIANRGKQRVVTSGIKAADSADPAYARSERRWPE